MTKLKHLRPLLLRTSRQYRSLRLMSKMSEDEGGGSKSSTTGTANNSKDSQPIYNPDIPLTLEDIEEPTNCCMSGCANCVWLQYAEKLSTLMKDSPSDIQKLIMDKVQDPNMRAFLSMELRVRKIIE